MNEFVKYCKDVAYHLGRPLTTEDVLFEVEDSYNNGVYAEECAEFIQIRDTSSLFCTL